MSIVIDRSSYGTASLLSPQMESWQVSSPFCACRCHTNMVAGGLPLLCRAAFCAFCAALPLPHRHMPCCRCHTFCAALPLPHQHRGRCAPMFCRTTIAPTPPSAPAVSGGACTHGGVFRRWRVMCACLAGVQPCDCILAYCLRT